MKYIIKIMANYGFILQWIFQMYRSIIGNSSAVQGYPLTNNAGGAEKSKTTHQPIVEHHMFTAPPELVIT